MPINEFRRDFTVIESKHIGRVCIGIALGPLGHYIFVFKGFRPEVYQPGSSLPDDFKRTGVYPSMIHAEKAMSKAIEYLNSAPKASPANVIQNIR